MEGNSELIQELIDDQNKRCLYLTNVHLKKDPEDGDLEIKHESSDVLYGWSDDRGELESLLYEIDFVWKELYERNGDGLYSLMLLLKVIRDGDGYRTWFYYEYIEHRFEYYVSPEEANRQAQMELEDIGGFNFFNI